MYVPYVYLDLDIDSMVQAVDMAGFSARFLALLRRFPNQFQEHSCLIMPAPAATGALVFTVSHNHNYLLFHDPLGFSNGVYEFGLPEEFFSAIGPRHVGTRSPGGGSDMTVVLTSGEYRLYENTDSGARQGNGPGEGMVFTWSGSTGRARQQLRDSLDTILYLHQEGISVDIEVALNPNYAAELDFVRRQLPGKQQVNVVHRWIRLPDNTLRCLTLFDSAGGAHSHVQAIMCVDAEMALG